MKRVQILLDEDVYETLRRRAFERRKSLAAVVREILQERLQPAPRHKRRLTLKDFPWIGSFSSKDPYPVSEQHDRALAEAEW
jgi:hypothetical protein